MSEQKMWKAKASLAKANRVPDVTLGLGLRRFEAPEDEALVVEMSVPIPILNRNQGKIKEIKALYQKSEAGKRSAAVRQNSMLFGLYQELSHAKIEIRKSKEEILPFAKKALKVAKDGFAKGRFSYLELSDAQRTFVEAKERYINSALEFQQLKLEIERLLGEPLQAEFKQISKQEK
jgi:cobalt-zinc-cadmium efflux system outer membrane protein